jgi:regulator of protease activity HflC (stomatin/prohibitin superfamily)
MMLLPWIFFLKEGEQLLVEGFTRRWVKNGPGIVAVPPLHRIRRRKGMTLGPTEYLRVRGVLTGDVRNEVGPKLFFPDAHEELVERLTAIPLKKNQYLRLIDKRSGVVRVERGETSVYLTPTEEVLGNVAEGVNIDEQTAVLVRDIVSGQLELITEPQVFIPAPAQEIVEARKRILLEDHETVVVKDKAGKFSLRRGTDAERAFFLEPYSQLVHFRWSTGIHKDQRSLQITHLDGRPKFMWYEFEARTQDNVELIIGITFFWQIVDVEAMIRTTDDVPGDVCSHARSAIIQSVSQVTLERFLSDFNTIVRRAILESDDPFYAERGVKLHAVEVRSIVCKDPDTQHILQEIIQETTNRLNRLQKQHSENEVQIQKIQGDIEAEAMRGQLLEKRREHLRTEGQMQGEAEAARVQAFFAGLGDQLAAADKIAIFNTLRKQEAIEALSAGSAQLYLTPADIDVRLETRPLTKDDRSRPA